jgi:hypothetical protein
VTRRSCAGGWLRFTQALADSFELCVHLSDAHQLSDNLPRHEKESIVLQMRWEMVDELSDSRAMQANIAGRHARNRARSKVHNWCKRCPLTVGLQIPGLRNAYRPHNRAFRGHAIGDEYSSLAAHNRTSSILLETDANPRSSLFEPREH